MQDGIGFHGHRAVGSFHDVLGMDCFQIGTVDLILRAAGIRNVTGSASS